MFASDTPASERSFTVLQKVSVVRHLDSDLGAGFHVPRSKNNKLVA